MGVERGQEVIEARLRARPVVDGDLDVRVGGAMVLREFRRRGDEPAADDDDVLVPGDETDEGRLQRPPRVGRPAGRREQLGEPFGVGWVRVEQRGRLGREVVEEGPPGDPGRRGDVIGGDFRQAAPAYQRDRGILQRALRSPAPPLLPRGRGRGGQLAEGGEGSSGGTGRAGTTDTGSGYRIPAA